MSPSQSSGVRTGPKLRLTNFFGGKKSSLPDKDSNPAQDARRNAKRDLHGISRTFGAKARPGGHKGQYLELADALDKARESVGLNPLTSTQRSRIKQSMYYHAGRQTYEKNRYKPLLRRIESRHTKTGQLKSAAILERIEKANDEPYDTGDRSYKRAANNGKCLDKDGERLNCSAHSWAVVDDVLKSKDRKSDKGQYSTLRRIDRRFQGTDPDAGYHRSKLSTTSRDVKKNRELGELLADHFLDMKPAKRGGDCVRVGFLEAGDHSVPIRLKRTKVRGRQRHVVTVGDFNRANGDRRLQKKTADEFRGYGLSDFFTPHGLYEDLLLNKRGASLLLLHEPDEKRGNKSHSSTPSFRSTFDADLTSETVSYILDANIAFNPDDALKYLRGRSTKEVEQILLARIDNHAGGIRLAMENGSAVAIKAYGKLLLSILDDPQHFSLRRKAASFLSTGSEDVNGVYWAMREGSHEAVAAYGDLATKMFKKGYISPKQFQDLFTWNQSAGSSALFMAAVNGHQDSVDAYLETIKCLPVTQRLDLLALSEQGGRSGIASALSKGAYELANNLFAVYWRAYQSKVITLSQLAVLAMNPEFRSAARSDGAGPHALRAYKEQLADIHGLIREVEHKNGAMRDLERDLKWQLALR